MARHGLGSVGFGLRQGDPVAVETALAAVVDSCAPMTQRLEFLAILGEVKLARSVPALVRAFREPGPAAVRKAALTALSQFDDPAIGRDVLELYKQLDRDTLTSAQTLLASRGTWSRQLVEAVRSGVVPKESVPLNTVRKIKLHRDPELVALAEQTWWNTGTPTTAQMEGEIHRLA